MGNGNQNIRVNRIDMKENIYIEVEAKKVNPELVRYNNEGWSVHTIFLVGVGLKPEGHQVGIMFEREKKEE